MTQKQRRLWLGIDTSTRILGLALIGDDGTSFSIFDETGEQHSRRLIPLLEELLRGRGSLTDICEVAVNTGPGSFTGLRVGIAAARGLSAALEIPLRGVSSFDAHATGGDLAEGLVVVLLGVSRGELAAGCREISAKGRPIRRGEDLCGSPEAVIEELNRRIGEGSAFLAGEVEYGSAIAGSRGKLSEKMSLAEAVAEAGRARAAAGEPVEQFEAQYLRAAEAEIRKKMNEL